MTVEGFSCLEGEGEVRGIQLQHAASPLEVTKFYTFSWRFIQIDLQQVHSTIRVQT